jgi:hypothetical protein
MSINDGYVAAAYELLGPEASRLLMTPPRLVVGESIASKIEPGQLP